MKEFFSSSVFFGVLVSLIGYELGLFLKKKTKMAIFNPLLISIIFVMILLVVLNVDYKSYYDGAKYLSYLLTPATVCLAIPLYKEIELLKKNVVAIIGGIVAGVLSSTISIIIIALIFNLNHKEYITLLPKSITTAIGMGVSEELGGIVTITVAVIIVTGIVGNIIAEYVCKLFRIKNSIAKGIGIGTASHAIGTAKAIEMGEVEGAMSGLAIAVSGILTVVAASIFANVI
ncbi:LrgB family protein [Clostridium sp. MSJ-8]|uniref:LrgB family protein n=1 Tax=Clostridium sp. MSJ-8 TaxID=2841510 RepID=UPI001C0EC398|nr:LrgB family protein [Clostridium sp. MSJ-8]MBU5486950.1 LrgB family protein [Clostridium sp. MSJ-8]